MTNAVYSSKRDQVFNGWTCAAALPYYEKYAQIFAVDTQLVKYVAFPYVG